MHKALINKEIGGFHDPRQPLPQYFHSQPFNTAPQDPRIQGVDTNTGPPSDLETGRRLNRNSNKIVPENNQTTCQYCHYIKQNNLKD